MGWVKLLNQEHANYPIKNNSCMYPAWLIMSCARANYPIKNNAWVNACMLDWSYSSLYRKPLALHIRSVRRFINTVWSDDLYTSKLAPLSNIVATKNLEFSDKTSQRYSERNGVIEQTFEDICIWWKSYNSLYLKTARCWKIMSGKFHEITLNSYI